MAVKVIKGINDPTKSKVRYWILIKNTLPYDLSDIPSRKLRLVHTQSPKYHTVVGCRLRFRPTSNALSCFPVLHEWPYSEIHRKSSGCQQARAGELYVYQKLPLFNVASDFADCVGLRVYARPIRHPRRYKTGKCLYRTPHR